MRVKMWVRSEGKALTFYWKIIQYYNCTHQIKQQQRLLGGNG